MFKKNKKEIVTSVKTEETPEKKLTIVFCIPGKTFTDKFMTSYTSLVMYVATHPQINPLFTSTYSCNLYYVRNYCLGGDVKRGINQKPFQGQIDYDYIMWIDSDMVFDANDFEKLLKMSTAGNYDILGGVYKMDKGRGYACGDIQDAEKGYCNYYKLGQLDGPAKLGTPMEVDYTGFGWLLIKKGVYEKLQYPWHRPEWIMDGNNVDFTMEDIAFCMNVKKAGFKIYVDPSLCIGHEKMITYK